MPSCLARWQGRPPSANRKLFLCPPARFPLAARINQSINQPDSQRRRRAARRQTPDDQTTTCGQTESLNPTDVHVHVHVIMIIGRAGRRQLRQVMPSIVTHTAHDEYAAHIPRAPGPSRFSLGLLTPSVRLGAPCTERGLAEPVRAVAGSMWRVDSAPCFRCVCTSQFDAAESRSVADRISQIGNLPQSRYVPHDRPHRHDSMLPPPRAAELTHSRAFRRSSSASLSR